MSPQWIQQKSLPLYNIFFLFFLRENVCDPVSGRAGARQWWVRRKDRFPASLLASVMVCLAVASICSAGSDKVSRPSRKMILFPKSVPSLSVDDSLAPWRLAGPENRSSRELQKCHWIQVLLCFPRSHNTCIQLSLCPKFLSSPAAMRKARITNSARA